MSEHDKTRLAQGLQAHDSSNRWEKELDNINFQLRIRHVLKRATRGISKLRVLDYGAGATPYSYTNFSSIQENQETVAYDPFLSENVYKTPKIMLTSGANGISWIKDPPVNKKFDIAVCHFSLHHINKSLEQILRDLRSYSPAVVAVADYDFTKAKLEEFKAVFISELEQKELRDLFGGDWEECFAFHSRYGLSAYKSALKKNGFSVEDSEFGEGVAKNKFLLIGKVH